jgi:hypothetical protein
MRPEAGDFAPYYQKYIDLVQGEHINEVIQQYAQPIKSFYNSLPESKANYAYADGKWTVKELLQHVMDTERVFAYRALCISRNDQNAFPGFDENAYVPASKASFRNLTDLQIEFSAIRHSTNLLFQSFDEEQLQLKGTASNNPVTVNALGYILFGHYLHHKNILEERYL